MGAAATLVGRNDLRGFPVGMSGRPGVGLDSITILDVAPFAFACAHVVTEELVWLRYGFVACVSFDNTELGLGAGDTSLGMASAPGVIDLYLELGL